jgi:hypothetical protein
MAPTNKDTVFAALTDEPLLAAEIATRASLPVKEVRDLLAELAEAGKAYKIGSKYSAKPKPVKEPKEGSVGDPKRHANAVIADNVILTAIAAAGAEGITKKELVEKNLLEKESLVYMSIWRLGSDPKVKAEPFIEKETGGSRSPKWKITAAGTKRLAEASKA